MKRLLIAIGAVAVLGVAMAALAAASPSSGDRADTATAAQKLPPLPSEVAQRKRWLIGVKCDFPPFGYINRQNKNAGYEIDVAHRFAELAFGRRNRVSLTCVTTPSRIPVLQQKRVDIIISWRPLRDHQLDLWIARNSWCSTETTTGSAGSAVGG